MKIIDFLGRVFNKEGNQTANICSLSYKDTLEAKRLAEEACINLISKTIARSEFLTFEKGKNVRGKNYYLFNIESNHNLSAYELWKETTRKLLREGEALVIIIKGKGHFLADSFTKEEYVFKENIYKSIVINGYEVKEVFRESEVFYFKEDKNQMKIALNNLNLEYQKLITSSMKGFHLKNTSKSKIKIPSNYPQTIEAQKELKNLFEVQMKDFLDPTKDAVLPEANGIEYTDLSSERSGKSQESERTTRTLINDLFDFIAIAYGVPPSLLKGDTVDTKDALNNFLAFGVNPIAKLITTEVNRKMYGEKHFIDRTYVKLDTSKIKSLDTKDIANSIDLLIRNGAYTIDDALRTLNIEPLGDDIGGARFMTMNNTPIEKMIEGGD